MELSELIQRFEKVEKRGNGVYQCACPIHNDKKPSLTITDKPDKILIHCHAGCSTPDILNELGLKMTDLYKGEKPPETWQGNIERYKRKQIEEVYHYTDENGKYLYTKLRLVGKDILYGRINADKTFFNMGMGGKKKTLYNLPSTIRAVQNGFPVYFVEGEKDVNTLKAMGLTATTCGGVQDWRKEFAPIFTGATVIILPDNDEPGYKLAKEVKRDLRNYAHAVKTVKTSEAEKGDVTDYIKKEGHTKEDLLKLVNEAEPAYAPWISETQQGTLKVNEGLLAESIARTLHYYLVRDLNLGNDDIYIYDGGTYRRCNKNEFKGYIRKYLPAGLVKSTLLSAVCSNILSRNTNVKTHTDFNTDENLINVKNGLVDIQKMQLLQHTPEVLTTYQLNCNFVPDARCDRYLKFLEELCTHDGEVDHEQIAVFQEYVGLILSNVNGYRAKKTMNLYSPLGNTGKTVSTRPLTEILGIERTVNVPIQKLSDRFSMGDIYGKRLILVGDQSGGQIDDSSIFKQLTGGDNVRVEQKGKTGFDYLFPGCILMICNNLPGFTDDKGGHIFERLEIMKCENVIPVEKRDPMLYDKIKPELDGIFLWGLEGLKRLIGNGFRFTQSCRNKETMQEYRETSDTLFRYISEKCEMTGNVRNDRIKKTDFESDYEKWCYIEGLNGVQQKNIRARMESYGIPKGKYCGDYYYKGIRYKDVCPF
ncbi:phage/plasmid primase, P4 family [Anaerotignum sp.]